MVEELMSPGEEVSRHQLNRNSSSGYTDPIKEHLPPPDGQQGRRQVKGGKSAFAVVQPYFLRWICISLHILLILMHVVLFIVWSHHWEHDVVVSLFDSSTASSSIVAVMQVYTTVYTVVLLVLTQSFAVQRILRRRQLLTATHDESSAWSGLGAALLSLWKQTYLMANIWGTLFVAIYLGCLSGIHITSPSLFSLSPFVDPGQTTVASTLGMPHITLNTTGSVGSFEITPFEFWGDITSMLPFMTRTEEPLLLGLHNGTLYDILDDNTGVGDVTVNATTFNVTCGYLPNATAIGTTPTNTTHWTISALYSGYNVSFDIPVIAGHTFRTLPSDDLPTPNLLGRNNYFYASMNMTDSNGSMGSVVTLNPPMVPFVPLATSDELAAQTIFAIQVMGCTLSLVHQEATVDAQTKNLISVNSSTEKTLAEWQPWLPGMADSSPWPNIADPLVDAWSEAFNEVSEGAVATTLYCDQTLSDNCARINLLEQYIMGKLGLYPGAGSVPNFTLVDLENAFSSMTASLYWAGGHVGQSQFGLANVPVSPTSHFQALRGQTTASVTEAQLNLNLAPLAAGLVLSVILCIFAIILIGNPGEASPNSVDSIGILQLVWLLHAQPSIQQRIGQVEEPTMENLRQAGMFEAQVASPHATSGLEAIATRNELYELLPQATAASSENV